MPRARSAGRSTSFGVTASSSRARWAAAGIVEIQAEASQPQVALDIANTYIEVLARPDAVLQCRRRARPPASSSSSRPPRSADALSPQREAPCGSSPWRAAACRSRPEHARRLSGCPSSRTTLAEVQANKNISQNRLAALKSKLESMPARPVPTKSTAAAAAAPVNPATHPAAPRQAVEPRGTAGRGAESATRTIIRESVAQPRRSPSVQRELGDAVQGRRPPPIQRGGADVRRTTGRAFAEMVAALGDVRPSLAAQEERPQGADRGAPA